MGNDNLALIAKEYVRRRDYEAAIAIIDEIAMTDTRKAQAVYRYAFYRTVGETIRHAIFNFIDNHSGLWIMLESSDKGKNLLHRLAR